MYDVLIKIDDSNNVTAIDSSAFVGGDEWTKIDEGEQYRLAQNNYLDKSIIDEYGCYNYKYTNDEVIERTQEEKDAEMFPQYIQAKISEIDKICTQTIYNGLDIKLSTSTEHFTLDEHDQANLLGLGLELGQGAEIVTWHSDNQSEPCKFYNAADAQKIISTLTVFKSYHITYFRDLRIYINTKVKNKEELDEITYGFNLPEENKSEVLKYYESILNNN